MNRQKQVEKKDNETKNKRDTKRKEHKLDTEKYKIDLKKFHEQLQPLCLKVKEMDGDGNCLFRAVADQLEGDDSLHSKYRRRTVEYILKNKEMYKSFIEDDETIEEYCQDMAKDGVWGDQIELNALASIYRFNAVVH